MKYILQKTVLREIVIEAGSETEVRTMYARGDIPDGDWEDVDAWLDYVEEEKE